MGHVIQMLDIRYPQRPRYPTMQRLACLIGIRLSSSFRLLNCRYDGYVQNVCPQSSSSPHGRPFASVMSSSALEMCRVRRSVFIVAKRGIVHHSTGQLSSSEPALQLNTSLLDMPYEHVAFSLSVGVLSLVVCQTASRWSSIWSVVSCVREPELNRDCRR